MLYTIRALADGKAEGVYRHRAYTMRRLAWLNRNGYCYTLADF